MSDYDGNHILFEVKAIEDRAATIKAGHTCYKDVEFCTITPPGGSLVIHAEVDDTVKERYASRYNAWLEGREEPVEGTPITMWPGASPAVAATLKGLAVHTVEALAGANDSILERIGPGARALQEKAKTWLASAEDIGKVAEQVAALTIENAELKERNAQLTQALAAFKAKLDEPIQGRPPVVVQELRELVA